LNWRKAGLDIFPVVPIAVFLYGMVRLNNPTVWVFTDALVIACVIADFLQEFFLNQIEGHNKEPKKRWPYLRLGRTWPFAGFFFGMLISNSKGCHTLLNVRNRVISF
jgi:hypothetical protein